jgi:hypothetical protein
MPLGARPYALMIIEGTAAHITKTINRSSRPRGSFRDSFVRNRWRTKRLERVPIIVFKDSNWPRWFRIGAPHAVKVVFLVPITCK